MCPFYRVKPCLHLAQSSVIWRKVPISVWAAEASPPFYWAWVRAPVLRTAAGKLLISAIVNIISASGCLHKQLFRFKVLHLWFFRRRWALGRAGYWCCAKKSDVTTQFHICLCHWLNTAYHWNSHRDERVNQRFNRLLLKWNSKCGCPAVQDKTL